MGRRTILCLCLSLVGCYEHHFVGSAPGCRESGPIELSPRGVRPQLASGAQGVLAVWVSEDGAGLHGRVVRDRAPSPEVPLATGSIGSAAAAATLEGFLVAAVSGSELRVLELDGLGNPRSTTSVAEVSGESGGTRIATDGSSAVLAYVDDGRLFATFMDEEGWADPELLFEARSIVTLEFRRGQAFVAGGAPARARVWAGAWGPSFDLGESDSGRTTGSFDGREGWLVATSSPGAGPVEIRAARWEGSWGEPERVAAVEASTAAFVPGPIPRIVAVAHDGPDEGVHLYRRDGGWELETTFDDPHPAFPRVASAEGRSWITWQDVLLRQIRVVTVTDAVGEPRSIAPPTMEGFMAGHYLPELSVRDDGCAAIGWTEFTGELNRIWLYTGL